MAASSLQFNRHRQMAETLPVLTSDYTTECLSFSRQSSLLPGLYPTTPLLTTSALWPNYFTVNLRGWSPSLTASQN